MNRVEERILESLDTEGLLRSVCDLIEIPSVTGEESAAQRFIAQLMNEVGLQVDVWEINLDALRGNPNFSMGVDRKEGLGVVGEISGSENRSLILNGHIDVVSPGDIMNWRHPPWKGTVEGGRLYGRGSVDMKGGLCSALYAVKAVSDAGFELDGRLTIESVVGEEDGGVGTLAAILRGYKAEGAIIMEPTELKVAPAQAGSHCFRIRIKGLSAHACVREEGVSALDKFMPLYKALMDLEHERNSKLADSLYQRYKTPIPLNIGVVRCGSWPSSVPEELVFEGRYGIGVDEDPVEAHTAFENALINAATSDDWLGAHLPEIEWVGGQFNPARTPMDNRISTTIAKAYEDATGSSAIYEGVTYGSDMRHLVNVGKIPTVLFGPGDVRLCHRPNENVPVDELIKATKSLALTITRFCGSC
jgi:acetylornithine deacetylase